MNWIELPEEGKFFNLDNICFIDKRELIEGTEDNKCAAGFIGGQSLDFKVLTYRQTINAIKKHHIDRGIT